ncbi:MAG TPA: hypothetical protein HPP94_05325 [Desulfuromonadales bacterium]|nr:hypothetical protein [Desulfuromonadales bacterium]
MAQISIDDLAAGMVLKSVVNDRNGRLLLPADTELSDKHLKIFRTWGVTSADIDGVDGASEGSSASNALCSNDPQEIEAVRALVARRYIHNDPLHPMIAELIKICTTRKLAHG